MDDDEDDTRAEAFAAKVRYFCGLMLGEGDFSDEPPPSALDWQTLMREAEAMLAARKATP